MLKQILSITLFLNLTLVADNTTACAGHIYLSPDKFGVIGGTMIKLAGLAPLEPTFKIKHIPMTKAVVGAKSEITIEYDRPWLSKDVSMQLSSTSGVSLLDETIKLDDFGGTVKIHYLLEKAGYSTINIKVSGVHKGKRIVNTSIIYIQSKKLQASSGSLQVSSR